MKRLSAGVVVVREAPEGTRVLLLRAYRNWDFPKGLVERGEEPFAAAVREVDEETGLDDLTFDWGHEFTETPPYANGKVARYYLARARSHRVSLKINPVLGRAEHHEYRWAAFPEAFELMVPRLQRVLAWAANKILAAPVMR